MVKLSHSVSYRVKPCSPYSFELTVQKPAGWSLFTPFEVYEAGTMWTALHMSLSREGSHVRSRGANISDVTDMNNMIVGVKLRSRGSTEQPRLVVEAFLKGATTSAQEQEIEKTLNERLDVCGNLKPFYQLAENDRILRHAMEDLYGMHSTGPSTIFSEATLAIMLQMTTLKRSNQMMNCLIQRYGQVAEFDGKRVPMWPTPRRIAEATPTKLAKACRLGYRAKHLHGLARQIAKTGRPTIEELERLSPEEAKRVLVQLPGIGDYSADIINPHGGFPIDVWSADVFGKLFYGREPKNGRRSIEKIKKEGARRWGEWAWMAFFYVVQDLENLSRKLGVQLRLE